MKIKGSRLWASSGFLVCSGILALGIAQAYWRGAPDFSVFYQAGRLVLEGRGLEIYRVSPDRFLYGPGFAWLFSPIAVFPRPWALALWCAAKVMVCVGMAWGLGQAYQRKSPLRDGGVFWGLLFWSCVFIARPLLIDFYYGQVNLMVLGACVWALLRHHEDHEGHLGHPGHPGHEEWVIGSARSSSLGALSGASSQISAHPSWSGESKAPLQESIKDGLSFTLLTWAALSKLFPLPLLLLPWLPFQRVSSRKRRSEQLGIVLGVFSLLGVLQFSVGWEGLFSLLMQWKEALLLKGLPLESHNQSFTALLYHYFSGQPTPVIAEGGRLFTLGWQSLSQAQIQAISGVWTLTWMALILGWLCAHSRVEHLRWMAILIGLLILPSYLIWKPYFVMTLPLAIFILHWSVLKRSLGLGLAWVVLFFVFNLSGFDFVGHQAATYLESASVLLLVHVALMLITVALPQLKTR
ncbi:MAG: glycosyltransferase family 87 protein [Bdellovibrionia bacterium]